VGGGREKIGKTEPHWLRSGGGGRVLPVNREETQEEKGQGTDERRLDSNRADDRKRDLGLLRGEEGACLSVPTLRKKGPGSALSGRCW